jgi:class 3 adenylate cyclase
MSGEIQYAATGDAYLAYQVMGEGPRDLLVVTDGFIPVDMMSAEPRVARVLARLTTFARVILFDRRGIGLSDPIAPADPPTIEQWAGDALAVLDAANSEQVAVLGAVETSAVPLVLAATHPERVNALVLVNGLPRAIVADDYPIGLPQEVIDRIIEAVEPGTPAAHDDWVAEFAPSAAHDPHFREWWAAAGRRGASPATARSLLRVAFESDVRAVLPTISAPTLLVHFSEHLSLPAGEYMRERMADARVVLVPGRDDFWWSADSAGLVVDEIEEFLTGVRGGGAADRVLATVLFTDIVRSTERASEIGDRAWRDVLDRHDAAVRRQLARFGGREVNTTGDGFVATFDGPARAVQCACAVRDAARQIGVEVRAGVHTGEVERRGDDISGLTVHIAARVAALASSSAVWVSRTVTDLVVGSEQKFADEGEFVLKGVPGSWRLFSVAD